MTSRRDPSPTPRAGASRSAGNRGARERERERDAHAARSARSGDDAAGIPAAALRRQQAPEEFGAAFEVCAWLRHHAHEALTNILTQRHVEAPALTQLGEAVYDIWSNHVRGALLELTIARKFAEESLPQTSSPIMVVFVVGTIWTYWIFIPPAAASWPVMVGFNSAVALSMWSYHEAVVTFPGGIPDDWAGDSNFLPRFALRPGVQARTFAVERKANGALRYCQKELKFKPDRAHYCRAMSCNILRMDHYCPFIVNCVGHLNHKPFMLFLFYTVVGTNMSAAEMIWALVASGPHSAMCTFMLTQGAFVSSLFAGLLTPFFGFHCWLLARNLTTIEYCEKLRESDVPRDCYSPYDRGLYENFISIMGDMWYYWPFPVGKPPGDGLHWRRGYDDIVIDTDTVAQAEPEERVPNHDDGVPTTAPLTSIEEDDLALGAEAANLFHLTATKALAAQQATESLPRSAATSSTPPPAEAESSAARRRTGLACEEQTSPPAEAASSPDAPEARAANHDERPRAEASSSSHAFRTPPSNLDRRASAEAASSSQRLPSSAEARSSDYRERNGFFQNVVAAVQEIGSDVAATGRELATGATIESLSERCQRSAEGYWQSFETQRERWDLLWQRARSAPEISTTVRGPPPFEIRTLGQAVSCVRWMCPSAL